MNPAQKISQLEDLDRKEQRSQRTASRIAWTTVGLAAVTIGLMILASYFQLSSIRAEIATLTDQKKKLQTETQWLERENDLKEKALWQIESPPSMNLPAAVGTTVRPAPPPPEPAMNEIAPRIYMHIVDQQDRQFAQRVSRTLTTKNYVVLGPEYRPDANRLKQTEVRYYKNADSGTAQSIVGDLLEAGATGARAVYLARYENSTSVRPRHFEIWFPAGVGDRDKDRSSVLR